MREDLIGGLRNALEHGSTLEQAIRSLVNAGYKEIDVQTAAKEVNNQSSSALPMFAPVIAKKPTSEQTQKQSSVSLPRQPTRINWIVVILSTLLVVSIIIFILSILFKSQVIGFIQSLLG